MSEDNYMPEWIVAKSFLFYDTDHIVESLKEAGMEKPTLDDVIEYIDECLSDYFTPEQIKSVELWDSDGNEL